MKAQEEDADSEEETHCYHGGPTHDEDRPSTPEATRLYRPSWVESSRTSDVNEATEPGSASAAPRSDANLPPPEHEEIAISDAEGSEPVQEEATVLYSSRTLMEVLGTDGSTSVTGGFPTGSVEESPTVYEERSSGDTPQQWAVATSVSATLPSAKRPRRARGRILVASGVGIGVLVVGLGALAFSPRSFGLQSRDLGQAGRWAAALLERGGSRQAPEQPKPVAISIKVTPPDAQIYLDGAPVANPYTASQMSDGAKHSLWIEAPGYVTMSRSLTFQRDLLWVLSLDRADSSAPAVTAPRGAR